MELTILIVLMIVGVLLLVVELFLLPGTSIAGLASIACIGSAIYYAYLNFGTTIGTIILILSIALFCFSTYYFLRHKTLNRVALHQQIKSQVPDQSAMIAIGDVGKTVTRLAEIGKAEFNNQVIEVRSIEGFINQDTPVKVKRITGTQVLVEPLK